MVAHRIRKYIEFKGISYYAFENSIGASRGSISKAVKENKSIGSTVLENILTAYSDLNPTWLLTGKGNMLTTREEQISEIKVADQFPLKTDRNLDLQNVPLYEIDAAAGLVALFTDTSRPVPVSYLQIPDLPPCDGAVYVRGDSMYPLLKSGDIVLYKEVHNHNIGILWGEMYLLSFSVDGDEYIAIKYIQKSEQEGYVKLVSHNAYYGPKDIPIDSIRSLALVKASVRFNTMG